MESMFHCGQNKIMYKGQYLMPCEAASLLNFSIPYEEICRLVKVHKAANNDPFGSIEQKWVEDLFTEVNYHKECDWLRNKQYNELYKMYDITE